MNAQPNQVSNVSVPPPVAPRKGWFARNWKWLVPAVLVICPGLPLVILLLVFSAIRSSDAAKESLLRAQSNPLLVLELGAPIKEGWLLGGSINVSGTSGDADLAVPISGPKAKAKIYVTAHKSAGVWSYSVMEAAIDGSNQRINLLSVVPPRAEAPPTPQGAPVQSPQATPPVDAQAAPAASAPANPPAPSLAPAAPAEQAAVIQTQETNEEGVLGELIECRRSQGVLNIKVRFRNTSDKPAHLTFTHWNATALDHPKYYVTAADKKYFMLADADGTVLSSNSAGNGVEAGLDPGKTYLWWAKYPAPPAEVTKINLMAPITAPIYALLEGLALGGISAVFELRYPGIAMQAVGLTFGTPFVLLMAYHSGLIPVTEKFRLGVVAATGGIFVFYLVEFVLGFFGVRFTVINGSGILGIGFSVVVVIVAALNLVLDFDFIERGVSDGAPKYMEWYGAFGLIVTLVWLYLEILRLLAKLNSRR